MGSLFSKKSDVPAKPVITKHDEAVLQLKLQVDSLRKYQAKLEIVINKELEAARTLAQAGKQRQALIALKKKKYQESLLQKTDGMLFNLQEMVQTIQFTEIEQKVAAGLQTGTECLKALQKEMSLDDIDRIMSDTADAIAYQQEIESALGSQLSADDEAEIEKQLEELEAAAAAEELPTAPATALPEAAAATTAEPAPAAAAPRRQSARATEKRQQLAA